MDKLQIIKRHSPFDFYAKDIILIDPSSKSLLELKKQFINELDPMEYITSMNNDIIPLSKLEMVIPKKGDCVAFIPVLGDNQVLRMFAFIGLTFFALWGGPALAGLLGFAKTGLVAGIFTGAVYVAGGLVINALLPLPAPKLPDSLENGQTYSWNPQTTQEEGLIIPKVYGKHRVFGNIINTYIYYSGTEQFINILVELGFGPLNSITGIKINETNVTNFANVEVETRLGLLDQDVIENFEVLKIEHLVSKLAEGGLHFCDGDNPDPVIFTTPGSSFTQLEVVVSFPEGLYGIGKGDGEIYDVSVMFQIGYKKLGESVWSYKPARTVNGKTRKPFTYVEHISVGYGYQYQVKLTKLSCEFDEEGTASKYEPGDYGWSAYVHTVSLLSVIEILPREFSYPRQAVVGINALAMKSLSGSLRFSCIPESIVRVYNGSSWSAIYSNNPAWVAYDILTQPVFDNSLNVIRYDGYDPSYIDLPKFLEWAQWCNELVSDGQGGTEKRSTFNGVFDAETSIWEAVLAVGQVGRAVVAPIGFKITVITDKARTPEKLFTVVADSFQETFLSLDERSSELEITFNNKDKNYERDTINVINPDINTPSNRASLPLVGITKATEAWRTGKYRLYCNQYLKRTVQFISDIDSLTCGLGEVINFSHEIPGWGYQGRVVSATTSTITLDRDVEIQPDKTYGIMVRLLNDTLVVRTITNTPGVYTTLNITPDYTDLPEKYDICRFGVMGKYVKPFTVASIKRISDTMQANIGLIEYNGSIYNVDTDEPIVPTPNYSDLELLPAVTGLTLNELLLKSGSAIISIIDVAFNSPLSSTYAYAEVWYRSKDSDTWIIAGKCDGYMRLTVREDEDYVVAVLTINVLGQKMDISQAPTAEIHVYGKLLPPSDIAEFWGEASIGGLRLQWSAVDDVDLDHYELRFHLEEDGDWEDSMFICDTYSTSKTLPAARSGKYLIKAVDSCAPPLKSLNAIGFYTNIPDIISWNLDEILTEHPTWTGDKVNLMIAEGNLLISDVGSALWDNVMDFDAIQNIDTLDGGGSAETLGSYTTAIKDLGSVQDTRCKGRVLFYGIDPSSAFDNILNFDEIAAFDSIGISSEVTAKLYMKTSQDMVTWGSWIPLFVADTIARAYQFQMITDIVDPSKSIEVHELEFEIDLPDREEDVQDITCPDTGLVVIFSKVFMTKPRIGITIQSMADGDYYVIESASTTGFTVTIKNGGVGVERIIDWWVKGF